MSKLPFDIYAIGSPTTIMEQYQYADLVDLVMTAKRHLPLQRPIHLFGAGHPAMFALAVAMGCDLFDSAAYALYAREGRYLTAEGTLHVEELSYLPCECRICARRTSDELAHLPKREREGALAEHNLYASIREVKQIKQMIRRGTLWELLRARCATHPRLWEGFLRLASHAEELERFDPLPTPNQAGITFAGTQDLSRPEILRHKTHILQDYRPPKGRDILLLIPEIDLRRSGLPAKLEDSIEHRPLSRVHVCMYSLSLGIIPAELAETFPLSQHIAAGIDQESSERKLFESIMGYISRNKDHYKEVLIEKGPVQYSPTLFKRLQGELRRNQISHKLTSNII